MAETATGDIPAFFFKARDTLTQTSQQIFESRNNISFFKKKKKRRQQDFRISIDFTIPFLFINHFPMTDFPLLSPEKKSFPIPTRVPRESTAVDGKAAKRFAKVSEAFRKRGNLTGTFEGSGRGH